MIYDVSIEGNQLSLPSELLISHFSKYSYGQPFIVTGNLVPSISIFNISDWTYYLSAFRKLSLADLNLQKFERHMLNCASRQTLTENAIYIDSKLKKHAGIRCKAQLVVFPNKMEIWNPSRLALSLKLSSQEIAYLKLLFAEESNLQNVFNPIALVQTAIQQCRKNSG